MNEWHIDRCCCCQFEDDEPVSQCHYHAEQSSKLNTLRKLLVIPWCENLHHPPQYRHEHGAACPAEKAVQEALSDAT